MGMCKGCGQVFSAVYMTDGLCEDCSGTKSNQKEKEEKETLILQEIKNILVTTEMVINLPIEKRFGIVSSQCIYGINIIKDLFSFARDIVGGRIESLEESLKDANNQVIEDLQRKAYLKGANAVIGVKIEHTYNNANGGSILSVVATGTLVQLSK